MVAGTSEGTPPPRPPVRTKQLGGTRDAACAMLGFGGAGCLQKAPALGPLWWWWLPEDQFFRELLSDYLPDDIITQKDQ